MYGIDVSGWQKGIDLSKAELDFGIVKVSEGVRFTDKAYQDHILQLTELNKLIGCYHFARPDLHGTIKEMKQEAEWFVSEVGRKGLVGKAILVLDWETEPIDKPKLISAWLSRVEELTGVRPFIYGSRSKLRSKTFSSFIKKYPIWLAVWPTIKQIPNCKPIPKTPPEQSPVPWKIWQFSSSGRWPGFNGNVDCDYTEMTKQEWLSYASCANKKPEKEVISDDMQWAIDYGLFKGDGNGNYYPKDMLTREQAATVFRRFKRTFCYDVDELANEIGE